MVMSFGSDVVEGDDDDGFGGWVEALGDGSSLGPIGFKKISQAKTCSVNTYGYLFFKRSSIR